VIFFVISGCDTHFKSELRRPPKWLHEDGSGQPAYDFVVA